MRGRVQASALALLGMGLIIFFWISVAAVSLVTLRRGPREGAIVLLIVVAFTAVAGVALGATIDVVPLTALVGATLAAATLRATQSWPLSLVVVSICGLLTSVIFFTVGSTFIDHIYSLFEHLYAQAVTQIEEKLAESNQSELSANLRLFSKAELVAMIGLSNALSIGCCLLLARWWQALLYNPGGFGSEMSQLRLSPLITVVMLLVVIGLYSLGEHYRMLAAIFLLPMTVAGFALAHSLVTQLKLGKHWLPAVYVGWFLSSVVKLLLVVLAVIDSFYDLRSRLKRDSAS